MINLSYLIIFYIFSCICFSISFLVQVSFLLKLFLTIQVSVYIFQSTKLIDLLLDIKPLLKYIFIRKILYFSLYVNSICNYIYKNVLRENNNKKLSIKEKIIYKFDCLLSVFNKTDLIIQDLPNINNIIINLPNRRMRVLPNLILIIIIITYAFILIISKRFYE
jgi:hypothetical protein